MIISSILNNDYNAFDNKDPYTFLEWFKQNDSVDPDVNVQFLEYKKYILNWTEKKKLTKIETKNVIQASYVQVLREIAVSYSTEEEKRFVTNADLNNPSDVEIVLPFFIYKLKQICLYYAIAREELKSSFIEYGSRGTSFGVEKIVKDLIFSTARLDISFDNLPCFFPPLSSIAQDLYVTVEEIYDTTDNYFNVSPDNISKDRYSTVQNLSSINLIFPNLYVEFKQAVVDAIHQYPIYIDSLKNTFAINPPLSGIELNYLKNRDFVDYLQSNSTDTLKLNLLRKLAPKYLANDFYYLSTGSTTTNFVSGLLFSVSPLTGAPTLNLLNRNNPSVATVPNTNELYTELELGRFFLPHHQGVLIHNTPQKTFSINTGELLPNTLYAFPDPNVVGSVSYNSNIDNNFPLVYKVDVSWNKVSRSNQFKFGDVFAIPYNSLYYGYQSREQDLNLGTSGISRVQDNVDFWGGLKKNEWLNADIWPGIDVADIYPNQDRQESLLVNKGTPVYWGSDIFNNDFCLIKEISPLKNITNTTSLTSQGIIPGQNTKVTVNSKLLEEQSIYNKKNVLPGDLYFRDNIVGKTYTGLMALSSVLLRYPKKIYESIQSKIVYFAIYGNTFVLETDDIVVVDSYNYDYDNNRITPTTPQGLFFDKFLTYKNIERFAGEWYSERDDKLYLCFLVVNPLHGKSSYKSIYPKIYDINLSPLVSKLIYPDPEKDIFLTYSLSANSEIPSQIDLKLLDGISVEFLNKTNIFNISYLGKNLNSLPFVVNEQIYKNEPYFYTYQPQIFQPFYYTVDTNYFTSSLPYFTKYIGSTTGIVGSHNFIQGQLNTSQYSATGVNYMYCDGALPVQLNLLGTYIVQFDWQVYSEVTVFIGCSGYIIRNTDSNLLWNADTATAKYLFKQDTVGTIVEKLSTNGVNTNILNVGLEITRLTDDPSLVKFVLKSNTLPAESQICNTPLDIFRNLNITLLGEGSGRIITDPFCIDCSSSCSELYPLNSTVTVIASADDYSQFENWIGDPCDLFKTDCIFTVTTAVNLTAYFSKLPIFDIIVTTPAGKVYSQDLKLYADAGNGSNGPVTTRNPYLINSLVTLSALTPVSGWAMYGWEGGRCTGIGGDRCTFFVNDNMNIKARYIRYYEYPLKIYASSYIRTQSAANDTIIIGADYVNDGVHTRNKFDIKYTCNSTCTFVFTGTNTSRYGNTLVTLSAAPSPGRKLKYWTGDSSCDSTEYVSPITDIITTIPVPAVNIGNYCTLEMDKPRSVTGVFDIGYYTLTLIISGDGLGDIFTSLPDPYFRDSVLGGDIIKYSVLSGTSLTVRCSALRGSTFLNLSSRYCTPIDSVSTCRVTMDNDVTVISTITATSFYTLKIVNPFTCGVQITAYPNGRYNQQVCCPPNNLTEKCEALYPSYRLINVEAINTSDSCGVAYFLTDQDIVDNGGLKVQYQKGAGLYMSVMNKPVGFGEVFSLIDGSIKLTPGGTPYKAGPGIVIEPKAFVSMTDNVTITAMPF